MTFETSGPSLASPLPSEVSGTSAPSSTNSGLAATFTCHLISAPCRSAPFRSDVRSTAISAPDFHSVAPFHTGNARNTCSIYPHAISSHLRPLLPLYAILPISRDTERSGSGPDVPMQPWPIAPESHSNGSVRSRPVISGNCPALFSKMSPLAAPLRASAPSSFFPFSCYLSVPLTCS